MVKANNTMTQEQNAFGLNKANIHANLGDEEKIQGKKQPVAKVNTPQPKGSSKFTQEFDESREGVETAPAKNTNAKPKVQVQKEIIPQFYFADGKPVPQDKIKAFTEGITKFFGKTPNIKMADFEEPCQELMGIPKIFMQMLFKKIVKVCGLPEGTETLNKENVQRYW